MREKAIKYLAEHGKDKTWPELSKQFGLPIRTIRSLYDRHVKKPSVKVTETANASTVELGWDEEIRTEEDAVRVGKIDLTKWEIVKKIHNTWGNRHNQNYQVKLWLAPKRDTRTILDLLESYKPKHIPIAKITKSAGKDKHALLISLCDFHIDKLTGDGLSMEQKCARYKEALKDLVGRSLAYNIEKIIYVVGNDFFTSDGYQPATTKGTPQDTTNGWYEAYESGFDLQVWSINYLKSVCSDLHVVVLSGNHDRTKSSYLGHALWVYFRTDRTITFDTSSEFAKCTTYGTNFFGFHHGDTNMNSLPAYFSARFRREWGSCKFSHIVLGDKHHRKGATMRGDHIEVQGCRVFILPTITGPDRWHKEKLYDQATLAGVVKIYHKDKGYIGELEIQF